MLSCTPARISLDAGSSAIEAAKRVEHDVCEAAQSAAAVFGAEAPAGAGGDALAAAAAPLDAFAAWLPTADAAEAAAEGPPQGRERREEASTALASFHALAWERIHKTAKAAPVAATDGESALWPWRELFAVCCLMRCSLLLQPLESVDSGQAPEALRLLDLAIIIAGPESHAAPALFAAAGSLAAALAERMEQPSGGDEDAPPEKKPRIAPGAAPLVRVRATPPQISHPVRQVQGSLSMEQFLIGPFATRTPVVVRGGCSAWPAVQRWDSEAFWRRSAVGQRFVPVEMDYWFDEGYRLKTVQDFVEYCQVSESRTDAPPGLSGGGYIAQHALMDQVPSLEADVMTPDMAMCGEEGHLLRQFFFGPKGTVTPIHFDPYENAFCQVVGTKYLRLYAPSEAPRLYPRGEGDLLRNNSTIEPADILEGEARGAYGGEGGRFPKLLEAAYVEVVMGPGDVLYLPRGWWHFVKSLSTSISVAFHFN